MMGNVQSGVTDLILMVAHWSGSVAKRSGSVRLSDFTAIEHKVVDE